MSEHTNDVRAQIRELGLSDDDAVALEAAQRKIEATRARIAASREGSRLTAPAPKPPAAKPADSTAANDAAPKAKSTGECFAVDASRCETTGGHPPA